MRMGLGLNLRRFASGAVDPTAAYLSYAAASPMWYDANDTTKTFQDTAGTTPATADTDPIGRISNKGTLSTIHWLQPGASTTRPLMSASGGKFLASFDGITRALTTGAATLGTTGMSLFIVVEPKAAETVWLISDSTNSGNLWAIAQAGSTADGSGTSGVGTPGFYRDGKRLLNPTNGGGLSRDNLATALPATERHILEIRDLNLTTANGLRFGDYAGWEFGGKVGEVIVGPNPTFAQRDSILYALASKWSITLPNSLAALAWNDSLPDRESGISVAASTLARIKFTTTATSITFVARTPTFDANYHKLGVTIDGVFQEVVFPLATAPSQSVTITPAAGTKTIILSNALRAKDGSEPQGTHLQSVDANASMTRVALPSTSGGIVFMGDSIMAGAAASPLQTNSSVAIVRATAPVPVIDDGLSGGSFKDICVDATARAAYVALIVAVNPAKMWIEHGFNDYSINQWTAAAFGTAYAALLDALHTALPSLQIYAQSPLVNNVETANAGGDTLGAYRTAISTAATGRNWVTYINGASIITTGQLADGTHPTNAGHATWATAIKTALGW